MVLDAALLNTQHYKVAIKVKAEQSREGVAPSLSSTKATNFTYIFIQLHHRNVTQGQFLSGVKLVWNQFSFSLTDYLTKTLKFHNFYP